MHDTWPRLANSDFPAIQRRRLTTLQVNLGYLCNLACLHCHVNAGPTRKELMDAAQIEVVLEFLRRQPVETLDLTGGSPEMNPHFRTLVEQARALRVKVMDRLNPTIVEEPGYEDLPEFFVQHQVELVASLPCYQEQNVDKQRGDGVFASSIRVLRRLN
ncbi:MAG: radical SAM protein, partial [Xanthomonadales bacterium]|nr:radical SAM protein [Xanthomonadales bacterium]